MRRIHLRSAAEQVADCIREEIMRGEMQNPMPGKQALAAQMGVNHKTVTAALALLEREHLLVAQGRGRRRRIALPTGRPAEQRLRIAILLYEPKALTDHYVFELQHLLQDAGHVVFFAGKSQFELGMNVRRIERMVAATVADAWIVCAGSRPVLEWFAAQPLPAFALFGRRRGVPLAGTGPDHLSASLGAVRRLLGLGHQRIVLIVRQDRRANGPGEIERAMLDEMEAHGIETGPYHLPDWEDSCEGFHRMLDKLYQVTPPSALIIDGSFLFAAAQQHLAQRGILSPQHVSLVCTAPDPTFAWCVPTIAHIHYDIRPVLARVVRWANHVALGKDDRRQSFTKAEFVDGGTVGMVHQSPHQPQAACAGVTLRE